ncbi:hypothetical protein SAY86_029321 [Trapa natans]|uniref:Uncharacterized protein n=1 Tax=Trapa natans TaxID=22666 RepID=A0AAN7M138_TRANT|nr:hypothetical protein SAY86_029321 [Trapa natans]
MEECLCLLSSSSKFSETLEGKEKPWTTGASFDGPVWILLQTAMRTPMVEDTNLEDDRLASMTTDDVLEVNHEDFKEGIIEVQAKKKASLNYSA